MSKKNKVLLIALISIVATICILFAAPSIIYKLSSDEPAYRRQAIINVEEYIKAKYPERNFTILEASFDKSYNGIMQSFTDPRGSVKIKDQDGNIYFIRTDATKKGAEGIESCRDDIQLEEIKSALISEIQKMVSINCDKTVEHIKDEWEDKWRNTVYKDGVKIDFNFSFENYHEKFNGDIRDFLAIEKDAYDEDLLEISVYFAYVGGNIEVSEDIDTEFLDLLEYVSFIGCERCIPSLMYQYSNIESTYSVLERFDGIYKQSYSLYWYNKETKTISEYAGE